MNLLEDDNLEHLFQLSSAVSYIADSAEAYRYARKIILNLVPCNVLLLFFDDRDRERLVAPYQINKFHRGKTDEMSISYDDPLANAILISRQTVVYADPEFPLVPHITNELFVPIVSPESVLGCLYFGRKDNAPFTLKERVLAEHAASLVAMPLERVKWEQRWTRAKKASTGWQEKYLSLLEAFPQPVAIFDLYNDSIEEVNGKFLKLIRLNRNSVFEKKLSEICVIHDLKKHLATGQLTFETGVELLADKGESLKVEAQFNQIRPALPNKHFAIFKFSPKEAFYNLSVGWLPEFLCACDKIDLRKSLAKSLSEPLSLIAKRFAARFLTLQILDANVELQTRVAYAFHEDRLWDASAEDKAALSEGPFQRLIQKSEHLFLGDVSSSESFAAWLPVAQKTGYQSLACVPLRIAGNHIGLLTLFGQKPRLWTREDIATLTDMAHVIAFLVDMRRLSDHVFEKKEQLDALESITKALNANYDLESLIEITAMAVHKVVPFDYLSFTIFDESGQEATTYDIASRLANDKLEDNWDWGQIKDSDLGWIQQTTKRDESADDMLPARPRGMPGSMPVHTSLLLISQENYLGNCALGRATPNQFSQQEITFLKQVTGQIALAIENARLAQKVQTGIEEISALAQASRTIYSTLNLEDIKTNLCHGARTALKADFCQVSLFDDRNERSGILDWMPGYLLSAMSKQKINLFIDTLEREQTPSLFDSSKKFVDQLCKAGVDEESLGDVKPFIIAPVVVDNKLTAAIIVSWNAKRVISENDIEIITTLASQARGALESGRLYAKSVSKAEELESFVYTVSHDLKNPIKTVRSFVTLLKEETEDKLQPGILDYFERIHSNLDQMENLIMDLLDLSRIGRVDSSYKIENAYEIIQTSMNSVSGLYEDGSIEFVISPVFPKIHCIKTQMIQVFSNLLSNAIKFSRKNPLPVVEIGCEDFRNSYRFFVKDNGIGIAPDMHEKIFELFHSNSHKDEKSTGVGLAIVKKVVETHGGKIWVESEKDNGAVFYFTLPKRKV